MSTTRDRIRLWMGQRVDAIGQQVDDRQALAEEAIAEIDRLERLLKAANVAAPPPARWPVVAAAVVLVVATIVLVRIRKADVDVDAALKVRAVSFQLSHDQPVLNSLDLTSFSATTRVPMTATVIDPGTGKKAGTYESLTGVAIAIETADAGASLHMGQHGYPAETAVTVSCGDRPSTCTIGSTKTDDNALLQISGRLRLNGQLRNFGQGSSVELHAPQSLVFVVAFARQPEVISAAFMPRLDFSAISFTGTSLTFLDRRLVPYDYSTVLGGSVTDLSIPDRAFVVRSGDRLILEFANGGSLFDLSPARDDLRVDIRGTARRIELGAADHPADLKPFYFVWALQAYPTIKLVLGGIATILAAMIGIQRWVRNPSSS